MGNGYKRKVVGNLSKMSHHMAGRRKKGERDTTRESPISRISTIRKPRPVGKNKLSKFDITGWFRYLNVHVNGILGRDRVPRSPKEGFDIINLPRKLD